MFALIEANRDHPLVSGHFFQVAIISILAPNGSEATLFLPDVRDGLFAALFWDDAEGNWGSGGWIPIAHADAEISPALRHNSPLSIFITTKLFQTLGLLWIFYMTLGLLPERSVCQHGFCDTELRAHLGFWQRGTTLLPFCNHSDVARFVQGGVVKKICCPDEVLPDS